MSDEPRNFKDICWRLEHGNRHCLLQRHALQQCQPPSLNTQPLCPCPGCRGALLRITLLAAG